LGAAGHRAVCGAVTPDGVPVLTTPRMQPHSAGHAGASRAGHL